MRAYVKRWAKSLLRIGVPRFKPRIVRELAHDPHAFTQGLTFSDGRIYESTGKPGQSSVRCLDPGNGQILLMRPIPEADVWAEGLSVWGNCLIQLTWKHCKAFVYSLPDLAPSGEIGYDGEGWGIATGHDFFVMSNGSDRLMFRDEQFEIKRRIRVTINRLPVVRLNDLEFVDGVVFANVWYSNEILAISAQSGKVLAVYDCQDLILLEQPSNAEVVLNGIAFNPSRGTFFLTGKYWKRIFEVEFESCKREYMKAGRSGRHAQSQIPVQYTTREPMESRRYSPKNRVVLDAVVLHSPPTTGWISGHPNSPTPWLEHCNCSMCSGRQRVSCILPAFGIAKPQPADCIE